MSKDNFDGIKGVVSMALLVGGGDPRQGAATTAVALGILLGMTRPGKLVSSYEEALAATDEAIRLSLQKSVEKDGLRIGPSPYPPLKEGPLKDASSRRAVQ